MDVNKVEYYGKVILDLTEDTVDKTSVLEGVTFHAKDGSRGVGTLKPGDMETQVYDPQGKKTDIFAYVDERIMNDAYKNAIAEAVKASLNTETWTFTLEDGSTVTKAVYVG